MAEKTVTTAMRLHQIMDQRGLKQTDILNLAKPYCDRYGMKLGKSDISQYVSGKVEPGQTKLTLLGLALNVSEAWLMGLDVSMEREISPTSFGRDRRHEELIELFDRLSPDAQALIVAQIKGILSAQQ